MSVIDKMLARIRGKAGAVPPSIINDDRGPSVHVLRGPYKVPSPRFGAGGSYGGWGLGYSSLDYTTQAREGYSRNSDVYACVTLIAEAASQVKWWDDSPGTKSLQPREALYTATGQPLVELKATSIHKDDALERARYVKKNTDPTASVALLMKAGGSAFINAWVSSLLISGDSFIELEPGEDVIKQLHLLRTDSVDYKLDKSGKYEDEQSSLEYWNVSAFGHLPRRVDKEWMVHSKLYNPLHAIDGMAPLDAAMINVLLQNEGVESIRKALNRGTVDGWIELDKDAEWGDEQIIALKEKMKAARTGEELTVQFAKWHERGIKPSESSYADTQALSKRDIASVYHVDPVLIGDMQGRTYATYRESRRGLYMEAVIPALTLFRDDWNRVIGKHLNSPLDFDKDSLDAITAAREEATDRVVKLWVNGLIDRTESRSDLHYGPVPGDEGVFYANASFVPMAEPGEEPPPAPPPPEGSSNNE